MTNIIALIFIVISAAIILSILRKHSAEIIKLELKDIKEKKKETKSKEKSVKDKIIVDRLKRNFIEYLKNVKKISSPFRKQIKKFFKDLYNDLAEAKEKHENIPLKKGDDKSEKIEEILLEIDALLKENKSEEVEKKLINIIAIDNKNTEAFRRLGQIYLERKKYEEAIETLKHVIRLDKNAQDYFSLSLAFKETGNNKKAWDNIKKALKLDPNNPRYLDAFLEISILRGEKAEALLAYKKLKEVNPENAKLDRFKKQIKKL